MTSITRTAAGALACVSACVALACFAQAAAAHSSSFAGHYTLSGEQWQLVYLDHYDSGGCHRHSLNHNYRTLNTGPFFFNHSATHTISCSSLLVAQAESVDLRADAQAMGADPEHVVAARGELCARFGLACRGVRGVGASSAAIATLVRELPVRFVRLDGVAEPGRVTGERIVAPEAGACITAVLDAEGFGPPEAGELERGVTLEVATPELARGLGHPC